MASASKITAEAIKKFREKKKLSQQQLASILNVSVTTVSRWETGLKEPQGTTRAVLAPLLSGMKGGVPGGGALAGGGIASDLPAGSGYAIFRLLKEHFEGEKE